MAAYVIHPLDTPCRCRHALWLHTPECLALVRGKTQMQTVPCGCTEPVKAAA